MSVRSYEEINILQKEVRCDNSLKVYGIKYIYIYIKYKDKYTKAEVDKE